MRWTFMLLLMLSACGGPDLPMADAAKDGEGKQFSAPAAGRSALYVFQTSGPPIDLALGQRMLGAVTEGNWLRVDVPAGNHDLRCQMVGGRISATLPVRLDAGRITFASTAFVPFRDPPCRLTIVAESEGRAAVLAGRRIREISGASD